MKDFELKKFLNSIIGEKIFVFGLGKSGTSVLNFLLKNLKDTEIYAFDKKIKCKNELNLPEVSQKNFFLNLNEKDFFDQMNDLKKTDEMFFIASPGIDLNLSDHFLVKFAKEKNLKIRCDIELFILLSKGYSKLQALENQISQKPYFIGITGTNGKSTVTALVNYVLQNNDLKSFIGGNFGIPIFDLDPIFSENLKEEKKVFYVIEVSSFQLDLIEDAQFDLGAIINITSDHLERYEFDQSKYIASKEKLIKLSDKIILGLNDENCLELFEKYNLKLNLQNKLFGAYYRPIEFENNISDELLEIMKEKSFVFNLQNNLIYFDSKVMGVESIQNADLKGDHNLQNLIIAYTILCLAFENDPENNHKMIIEKLNIFDGLEHRMRLIAKYKNIYFINDSKATSGHACKVSLKCFDNVYLILGGVPKTDGLTAIKEYLYKIKKVYLIGKAAEEFAIFFNENHCEDLYKLCETLENATKCAFEDALKENENLYSREIEESYQNPDLIIDLNILFSPACASFDQFDNFEHRGEKFIECVFKLLKK